MVDGAQNEDIATVANKLAAANGFTTGYLQANVSYGEFQIEDAKLYLNAVSSLGESLTAALDGLDNLLETFPAGGAVRVKLETTLGDIVLEMYEDAAPITVVNFLAYVDSGFYDETWFHRIISGFVIQGGLWYVDPETPTTIQRKTPGQAIVNESSNGLSNVRGSVAMARTSDPHSATSQYYINVGDNSAGLDYSDGNQGYAVYAYVVSGMDVVDNIASIATGSVQGVGNDFPAVEMKVISAKRVPN